MFVVFVNAQYRKYETLCRNSIQILAETKHVRTPRDLTKPKQGSRCNGSTIEKKKKKQILWPLSATPKLDRTTRARV